jgi:NAD(P)-dependent dehydrogenase (short-subunit alcohol dehydrogenase family)
MTSHVFDSYGDETWHPRSAPTLRAEPMNGRLAGKAGVVTGATSGLGLATIKAMTAEGARIIAVARNGDRGQAAVQAVQDAGGEASFFRGDVTQEADVVGAIKECQRLYGRLDIMHNNAGVIEMKTLTETSTEDWERVLAINLSSVFWGCKHAVLAMQHEGHGGSIINTGSTATFAALAECFGYVATKHGLLGITRATALGYAKDGIRCNALCPGDFESALTVDLLAGEADPDQARRELAACYPTDRILQPEDVAGAAVFLASDEAHAINGTSLVVDDAILTKLM